jgi:flagella basal body P-ring formation protein FlgA
MALLALLLAAAAVPTTSATPVLARPVERGEILSPDDFVSEDRPAAAALGALAPKAARGMEAVRRLAPGSIVRTSDVMAPRLVRRGEPVTLTVRSGALTITAQGRALADGRRGDFVRVVTLTGSRTLEGAVDGPATVRIAAN